MNILNLSLQVQNLIGEVGNFDQLLLGDLHLSLILCNLNPNHPNFIFNVFDVHLSRPEDVFLDIGFLIENAKLIITIDELNTSEVSIFTGLFILLSQTLHISL